MTEASRLADAFAMLAPTSIAALLDQFAVQRRTTCGYSGLMWVMADNSTVIIDGPNIRTIPAVQRSALDG